MKVKQRILERERIQKEEQEKRIKALVDELNDMVGLSEVKEEIRSLVNLIKIRKAIDRDFTCSFIVYMQIIRKDAT